MTIEVFGIKFHVVYLMLIGILTFFIFTNILTCTCKLNKQEAYSLMKEKFGGKKSKEGMNVMGYNDSIPKYGDAVEAHEKHDMSGLKKNIDIEQAEADKALDEEKLFVFANTKFLPECCPSSYTTGQGCACISDKIKEHIGTRGGNNKQ